MSIGADIADLNTKMSRATGAVESGVSKINSAVSAMKATAAFGAVVAVIHEITAAADEIDTISGRIGETAENVQRLQAISESFDVEMGSVVGAIQVMQQKLGDGKLDDALKTLNINVDEFKALSPAQQFIATAEALAKIKDPAERAAAAQEVHGKAAKSVAGAYRDGVGDVDRWIKMSSGAVDATDRMSTFFGKAKASLVNFSAEVLYSMSLLRQWDQMKELFGKAELPEVKNLLKGPAAASAIPMPSGADMKALLRDLDEGLKLTQERYRADEKIAEKLREQAAAFKESIQYQQVTINGWNALPVVVEDTAADIAEVRDSMAAMADISFVGVWAEYQQGVKDSGDELDNVHERMRKMLTWRDVGARLSGAVIGALQGGGDIGKAVGGEAGQMLGTKLGTTIGDWAGKNIGGALGSAIGGAAGSILPVVGTMLGSVAGGLIGKLFGGGNKDLKEIGAVKITNEFKSIQSAAEALGISMSAVFSAKKIDDFKKALGDVTAQIDEHNQMQERGIAAMERYGITVEQAGQKFKQTQMNMTAEELVKDFTALVGIGVDLDVIIDKMGSSVGAFVHRSIEMGTSVPREMEPIIRRMIETGSLLDKNGEKFTDISQIPFADSLNEGIAKLITALNQLLDKIGKDLPDAINRVPKRIGIDVDLNYPDESDGRGGRASSRGGSAAFADSGSRSGDTHIHVHNPVLDGFSSTTTFARRVLDALSQEQDRRGLRTSMAVG